jgi:hypothetical protein
MTGEADGVWGRSPQSRSHACAVAVEQNHLDTPKGPHIGAINRPTTGHIRKPLPRARGPAWRRRLHRRRQHHLSPHPLWNPQLPLSRRPPTDAWTVLVVDGQDRRQDRHPPTQPDRSRALPGVDRQRPPATRHHHPDAPGGSQGHRTDHERGQEQVGQGLIASLDLKPQGNDRLGYDPQAGVVAASMTSHQLVGLFEGD